MNCKSGMNPLFSNRLPCFLLALILTAAPGCLLRRDKPAATPATPQTQPDMSARRDLLATGGAATAGGAATTAGGAAAATGTAKTPKELAEERRLALMKDTGFDMINPNFSKKTGRKDPFEPVSISMAPFEWLKKMAPDNYRLVATARGFKGTFALIEMGKENLVVQKGDMIKGDMKVLEINVTDVVLEQNGEEKILGMKVRERTPAKEKAQQVGKLPNLNDLWENYLKEKYEAGEEGGEKAPKDFSAFVTSKEKGFKEEGMFGNR